MTHSYSEPFLLSRTGSDRATAYPWTNKIVISENRIHVVWTDVIARTCARTFDLTARQWGETVVLGEGQDNHNNPALTCDAHGALHLAYGPHGLWDQQHELSRWPSGTFRFSVGRIPGSWEGMEKCAPVGYHATYASLLHTRSGRSVLIYRGGEPPYGVQFQIQRPNGGWLSARELLTQNIPPIYTHYGAQGMEGPDGRLFVAAHFYNSLTKQSAGIGILQSPDEGETWLDMAGCRVELPACLTPQITIPSLPPKYDPRNGGLAITPDGTLWHLVSAAENGAFALILNRWTGQQWISHSLAPFIPPEWGPTMAILANDARGRLHILMAAVRRSLYNPGESLFAHPSTQIFHLCSADAGTSFTCCQISDGDPDVPSWLPSLSLPGPWHPVPSPAFLFTKGRNQPNGSFGCRHTWESQVLIVRMQEETDG